jgi:hypothetical protein
MEWNKQKVNTVKYSILSGALAAGLVVGLSACTNSYDPGQRALGGAAIGAANGGAVAEVATTPPPPAYGYPPPRRYVAETACGPGWHWIRSHHDRSGRLVLGHCAPR